MCIVSIEWGRGEIVLAYETSLILYRYPVTTTMLAKLLKPRVSYFLSFKPRHPHKAPWIPQRIDMKVPSMVFSKAFLKKSPSPAILCTSKLKSRWTVTAWWYRALKGRKGGGGWKRKWERESTNITMKWLTPHWLCNFKVYDHPAKSWNTQHTLLHTRTQMTTFSIISTIPSEQTGLNLEG